MTADERPRLLPRPVANPLPLGFLALAGGTLLVSGLQLEWLKPEHGQDVALIVLAFVFPLQLVASILGFLRGDVVAGTGMGLLAGTWLAISLVTLTAAEPGATSDALGLFLLLAGVALAVPGTDALPGKAVPAAVILTSGVRFFVTGIYQLTSSGLWKDVAGVVGVTLCVLAVVAA